MFFILYKTFKTTKGKKNYRKMKLGLEKPTDKNSATFSLCIVQQTFLKLQFK